MVVYWLNFGPGILKNDCFTAPRSFLILAYLNTNSDGDGLLPWTKFILLFFVGFLRLYPRMVLLSRHNPAALRSCCGGKRGFRQPCEIIATVCGRLMRVVPRHLFDTWCMMVIGNQILFPQYCTFSGLLPRTWFAPFINELFWYTSHVSCVSYSID